MQRTRGKSNRKFPKSGRPGFLRQPRNVEGVRWEPVRVVGFWPRNNGKSLNYVRGT